MKLKELLTEMAQHVTHQTFDQAIKRVLAGKSILVVPNQIRQIQIKKDTILKFRKTGKEVIRKDASGRGFRLASGKKYVYVFDNQLIEIPMVSESITIPIKKGDTILVGKWRNKPVTVKKIGKDERGLPTVNDRSIVNFRFAKKPKKESMKLKDIVNEMPHLEFGRNVVDLHIEKYPISKSEKRKLIKQYNSDEGVTGFSNKFSKMLRFKRTGVQITPKYYSATDAPSHTQLPHYWEKYAKWY